MWGEYRVLNYRFSEKTMQSRIREATLHVHVWEGETGNWSRDADDDAVSAVSVVVTRVWRSPGSVWSFAPASTATAGLTGAQRRNGAWLKVDVTDALSDWMALPRSGLGLVVRAHATKKKHPLSVTHDPTEMVIMIL